MRTRYLNTVPEDNELPLFLHHPVFSFFSSYAIAFSRLLACLQKYPRYEKSQTAQKLPRPLVLACWLAPPSAMSPPAFFMYNAAHHVQQFMSRDTVSARMPGLSEKSVRIKKRAPEGAPFWPNHAMYRAFSRFLITSSPAPGQRQRKDHCSRIFHPRVSPARSGTRLFPSPKGSSAGTCHSVLSRVMRSALRGSP